MPNVGVTEVVMEAGKRMQNLLGDPPGTGSGQSGRAKQEKNLAQQLKRLAGIDLGLGALLKQSQIFTGYMGNLFAIVGAIIDTVLAPLAPLAFKALAALGKKIPAIGKMAEEWIPRIVDRVTKMVQGFDGFMKKWWPSWSGFILKAIGILMAINVSLRFIRASGSMAYGITGARGAVGVASKLMGKGGPVSQAAQNPPVTQAAASGGGWLSRFRRGSGAAPVQDASGRWRIPQGQTGAGQFVAAPGTGAKATAWGGKAAAAGRMLGRGVPIVGAVTSGAFAYAGGRDQGMSKGQSMARAGFGIGGAVLGGALGSFAGPMGTMAGGALGAMVGPLLFDALFGKKGGGGGATNINVSGGIGASGYSVPTFIAESAEAFSESVLKNQLVLDDNAVALAALELAANNAAGSVENMSNGMDDWTALWGKEFAQRIEDTGGMGQQDDPTDPGGGEAGAALPAGGLFPDKKAQENAAAAAKAAEEKAAIEANEEFLRQQKIANDRMIAEDQAQADRAHKEWLAEQARIRQEEQAALEAQFKAHNILENYTGDGTLGEALSAATQGNVTAGGGTNQGDLGGDFSLDSGGASSGGIHITQVHTTSNKVDQSTASKVGSAWSHVVYSSGEHPWM